MPDRMLYVAAVTTNQFVGGFFREQGTLITLEYLGFDLAVHPWEPKVAP